MRFDCKIASLAQISTKVDYGYTASATNSNTGCRFLRITDIQNGYVNWELVPYCEIETNLKSKYLLEDGDILVARTGNSTGENFLYKGNKNSVFASYLIRFRINSYEVDPNYVWQYLRSSYWWDFVQKTKNGSAQEGMNAREIGKFKIYFPPLPEQKKIAETLSKIESLILKTENFTNITQYIRIKLKVIYDNIVYKNARISF